MKEQVSMAKAKRFHILSEEVMGQVYALLSLGWSPDKIADAVHTSSTTVRNLRKAREIVLAADWKDAAIYIRQNVSFMKYIKYNAEKIGVTVPDFCIKAYEDVLLAKKKQREERDQVRQGEAEEPQQAFPFDDLIAEAEEPKEKKTETGPNNDVLYFVKLLELLGKTNELLEQMMDVVIPKYVSDVKDNFNVNFDLVCERLKGCEDKLEKVVYNTRKRGT